MDKKITGIHIRNGFFESVDLKIFKKENERISIIFGANGTGKTTVGRAVSNMKTKNNYIEESFFVDSNLEPLHFNEEQKSQIYVFNEDFIEERLRFKTSLDDKFKSIVIFSENIKNEDDIARLKVEITNLKENIEKLNIPAYLDENDILSPQYHRNKLIKELKNDWSIDEQKIRNTKSPPIFNFERFNELLSAINQPFDLKVYNDKIDNYLKIRSDYNKIETDSLNRIINFELPVNEVSMFLTKSFERPAGNKLIERISKTIAEKSLQRIDEIKDSFKDGYCPFCFRDINKGEVSRIIEEINTIQNKEIRKFQLELESKRTEEIMLDLKQFYPINEELALQLEVLIKNFNSEIIELNKTIDQKINSPYDPIYLQKFNFDLLMNIKNKAIELEKERITMNKSFDEKEKLKTELSNLNLIRFAHKNQTTIQDYQKQIAEKTKKEELSSSLQKNINEKESSIKEIKAKSSNIGVALEKINKYLGIIFFDKKRLTLSLEGESYVVKCRNNNIALRKLSNGERNAIALCYFFALINEGSNENEMFRQKLLVVLDDPLSSFDYNNKVGIYSFLGEIIGSIQQNNESRIIFLTHQIDTYFDLINIIKNKKSPKIAFASLILRNKTTSFTEGLEKKVNLYSVLIKEIYEIITKNNDSITELELDGLGNKIRRVMESFSTFNYDLGFSNVLNDETILNTINDKELEDYFKRSVFPLALNSSSHLQNRTYAALDSNNFFPFDKDELLRINRDAFALLYLLNKTHIEKMLETIGCSFIENHIDYLKKEIHSS